MQREHRKLGVWRAQSRQRRYSAPGDAGDPSLSLRCHRGKHPHGTHTRLQLFAQSAPTRGQAAHGGHSAQGGARPLRPRGGAERKLRLWGQTAGAEPRPSRSRAASHRLAASAPSLGEAGQDKSRLPWGTAEVKRGAIHVNSVQRCRPSSATAPSGVTANIAPREL